MKLRRSSIGCDLENTPMAPTLSASFFSGNPSKELQEIMGIEGFVFLNCLAASSPFIMGMEMSSCKLPNYAPYGSRRGVATPRQESKVRRPIKPRLLTTCGRG